MYRSTKARLVLIAAVVAADLGMASEHAAERVAAVIPAPAVRELIGEVLERNPDLRRLESEAAAADHRPAQVRSLPDPTASLTLFLQAPQTRVGPRQAAVSLAQKLPWFGTLTLREQVAVMKAAAARSRLQAARLHRVTEVRRLVRELVFVDRELVLVGEEQVTLARAEEAARARYAAGAGGSADVIRIQAEITRARSRQLDVADRRQQLVTRINALRDRAGVPFVVGDVSQSTDVQLPARQVLRRAALAHRPELAAARAEAEAAALEVELAEAARRPELTLGMTYALVGERDDEAGRVHPPEGNGDDVFGLSGGVSLPIWGERNSARVEEQRSLQLATEEGVRAVISSIEEDLGRLTHRIPLLAEQRRLTDRVLEVQAEEAFRAAEAAYAAGTGSAGELLDAERVLVSVRIASARLEADLVVALVELDGALGTPWTGVIP